MNIVSMKEVGVEVKPHRNLRGSYCFICKARIPKRVTYLYCPQNNAWMCKYCWDKDAS